MKEKEGSGGLFAPERQTDASGLEETDAPTLGYVG